MDFVTFISVLGACYAILTFFDVFFKSCAHYPYLRLLDGLGIKIGYFTIKWKTKALNRLILKLSNSQPSFWRIWFKTGTFISLLFLPLSLGILFSSIWSVVFRNNGGQTDAQPLTFAIVPGLNLPLSELGFYSITLLVCSAVHELGHAFAAGVEDIAVLDIGCNLFFILPVAYVSLPTDKLKALNLKKRLAVFTAGIWHNIVLSLIAYLLYSAMPSAFSLFYTYGHGISVSKLSKHSPLNDAKGLQTDDVIVAINDCPIFTETDWLACLNNKEAIKPAVCIKSDVIHILDESVPVKHLGGGYVECCDPANKHNLCFEYVDFHNNELELPAHVCLPGRKVLERSKEFCSRPPHACPDNLYCFKPILANNSYLFKIECASRKVIFIGHPMDLIQTVEVSSYVKKTSFLSVTLPNVVEKFLQYFAIISLGLGFVNILPVVFMDGEFILRTVALIICKNFWDKRQIIKATTIATWIGSIILVTYVFYSVISLI